MKPTTDLKQVSITVGADDYALLRGMAKVDSRTIRSAIVVLIRDEYKRRTPMDAAISAVSLLSEGDKQLLLDQLRYEG